MKILKQGLVFRAAEGPFRYQAWPSICQDENGVLYAAWSGLRSSHVCPFGKDLMSISRDGGETWSCPIVINDSWLDDRDAGLTYLGDGKMALTYFCHPAEIYRTTWRNWILDDTDPQFRSMAEGFLKAYEHYTPEMNRTGSFIRLSEDYGKSWGAPIKSVVTAPHGVVKTISGRLLYLGTEFNAHPSRYDKSFSAEGDNVPLEDQERVFLYESFDDGKTWEKISKIDLDYLTKEYKMLCEPHIVELPSGELIAAIRAENSEALERFSLYFTSSTDGGKTWSKAWEFGRIGSPPHLLLRKDGSVVVTYGRRRAPFGNRASISYDGCRTFGEECILSETHCGDLGYPATTELADGSLVTVYYQPFEGDNRTSIFFTKWRA